jgi:nucleoside-diphosphate-sugar epimerase
MSPIRALVTGATGFVGAHLARHLVGLGCDVHVLCRPTADMARLADIRHAVVPHVADLREPHKVAAAVTTVQPDRVFHLAAATMHAGRSPGADELVVTNLGGTVALMEACRELEVDAFVNVGDAFEYGPGEGPIAEMAPCRPASLEGITKLAATLYGRSLAQSVGMPVVTVRPFSIVGCADDPARLVPRLVETARTGTSLAMSDRRVVRDFVSVGDAIDLFVLAADRALALRGRILNCGSGTPTTLGELVDTVERVTGSAIEAEWGAFPVAAHDLRHPIADIAAARALGWRPATSLDEMIEQLWSAGTPAQSPAAGSGSPR